ncbi:MAG TPA: phosphoglycerate kinase [Longimicrobiales bacterium]|nr:phosphoglycerate kinase [Longimicrobiales bacterium]
MQKARLSDLPDDAFQGKTVLVRVDLNVPIEDGDVTDDTRIDATVPTLRYLTDRRARVVVASHLGRPAGPDPAFSLEPVAARLGERTGRPVSFVGETVGPQARAAIEALEGGEVLVLENTRFEAGETDNDRDFAAELAGDAELFVQDAFGTVHRAHASTAGAASVIRERGGRAVAGLLLEKELQWLGAALEDPDRPFVSILGGAKISGKIDVVSALLPRVDRLLICGAMANTFWLARGHTVGESLVEPDRVDVAREIMEAAGDRLLLPVDARVATALDGSVAPRVAGPHDVAENEAIGDIGPETEALYAEVIGTAATVVWNGPAGIFEERAFAAGTLALARAVADATDEGAVSIIGGGDSARAAAMAEVTDRITHISTGGGASLAFLAGEPLPGVEVLSEADDLAGEGGT